MQAHTRNFEHSPLDTHTASMHIAHNYISVTSVVKTESDFLFPLSEDVLIYLFFFTGVNYIAFELKKKKKKAFSKLVFLRKQINVRSKCRKVE